VRIGIALPTLADGDAVGNDVFGMTKVLRKAGHDVQFFAWQSRVAEPVKTPEDLPRTLNRADDVLIYHHSIGCDWAVKAVEKFPGRAIVKYHNVTPPAFFKSLNKEIAKGCEQGLREVTRLAKSNAVVWADSEFNALDFRQAVPGRSVEVLPPFHHAEQLFKVEPDYRAVQGLDDWATNILLVGRLVPNKNIPLAVRAFAEFRRRYESRARLIVVGDRPVPEHAAEVDAVLAETGQANHVIITGKVTVPQLKALYLIADCLLVTSLHEGFCVPLIEAMGLMLPIVAVPNAAIPFTGGDAVFYTSADPATIAAVLQSTITGPDSLLAKGRGRYREHFSEAALSARFETLFAEAVK